MSPAALAAADEILATYDVEHYVAYPHGPIAGYDGRWLNATREDLAAIITRHAETALRSAWDAGFALCRAYGNNHAHFAGEQKERQWQKALAALNQPST